MSKRNITILVIGVVAVAAGILAIGTVLAGNPAQESTAPVFWAWEGRAGTFGRWSYAGDWCSG
jgi:hypothetical protein